jgi:hypothetical protein
MATLDPADPALSLVAVFLTPNSESLQIQVEVGCGRICGRVEAKN